MPVRPASPRPTGNGKAAPAGGPDPKPEPPNEPPPPLSLAESVERALKDAPEGPFSEPLMQMFARLEREHIAVFARLARSYPALVMAMALDAAAVRAALENASNDEVVAPFIDLVLAANLDRVETDALLRLVAQKSGVKLRPLQAKLKQARAELRAERAETARAKRRADPHPRVPKIRIDDFFAYMPQHNYIFIPTREFWPAGSINARLPRMPVLDDDGNQMLDKKGNPIFIPPSMWLDENRPVEQITWAPGEPLLIKGRVIAEGGWIERPNCTVFNLYRPPTIVPGDAAAAGPWLDHVRRIYPNEAEHILDWLAHRVQRPGEKINHALDLGGEQGIGKDTMLEPVKRAVGSWNVGEVSGKQVLGRFNGFIKSVILRVSEARDLGEFDRYDLYDHMKTITAAPPDVLRVDEKNLREHNVVNVTGVIMTTNYKTDGIFLPTGDRRHFVAWSERKQEEFNAEYWNKLYRWYDDGGDRHVAAYLAKRDISKFNPKAPPVKTPAFWAIAGANAAPEESELADVLDQLGNPDATTLIRVQNVASGDFSDWLKDRKNRRQIPHRFEQCGYSPIRNDAADDGLWHINGKRQTVYARHELSPREQIVAARGLADPDPNEAAPTATAQKPDTRLRIVAPEPNTPCRQCNVNDGNVFLIRNRNLEPQPLHEECAPFFFKLR